MERENVIPGLDFLFQLLFPFFENILKESYGPYIAHITQGTDMYKIPYSEQAWQIYTVLWAQMSSTVPSQMCMATRNKEKTAFICSEKFSVEMMSQVISASREWGQKVFWSIRLFKWHDLSVDIEGVHPLKILVSRGRHVWNYPLINISSKDLSEIHWTYRVPASGKPQTSKWY